VRGVGDGFGLCGRDLSSPCHAVVTAATIFRPDPGFFERFHQRCDGRSGVALIPVNQQEGE
jgi:hypothetical protein